MVLRQVSIKASKIRSLLFKLLQAIEGAEEPPDLFYEASRALISKSDLSVGIRFSCKGDPKVE